MTNYRISQFAAAGTLICLGVTIYLLILKITPFLIVNFIVLFFFLSYQLGKEIILRRREKNWQRDKVFIEAQQIEQIATSPSIELFPDIQLELITLAIEKYKSIGEEGYANDLQAKSQAPLSIR